MDPDSEIATDVSPDVRWRPAAYTYAPCFRITITAAAFEAIAATLPSSVGYERMRSPNGEYHVWREPRFVDRLRAIGKTPERQVRLDRLPLGQEGR